MLVLTREAGQWIRVADALIITVRDVGRDMVVLSLTSIAESPDLFPMGSSQRVSLRLRQVLELGPESSVWASQHSRGRARLVFSAPRHVAIVRGELIPASTQVGSPEGDLSGGPATG
jgi:sRNA-binding carbon storage regulator CsrA